jgi:hypothetical protein
MKRFAAWLFAITHKNEIDAFWDSRGWKIREQFHELRKDSSSAMAHYWLGTVEGMDYTVLLLGLNKRVNARHPNP